MIAGVLNPDNFLRRHMDGQNQALYALSWFFSDIVLYET